MQRLLAIGILVAFVLAIVVSAWLFAQCDAMALPQPLKMAHPICGAFMGIEHIASWRSALLTFLIVGVVAAFAALLRRAPKPSAVLVADVDPLLAQLRHRAPSMKPKDSFSDALAHGRIHRGSRAA